MSFWHDADRREAARLRFELRMAIPVLVAAALLTAVTLVLIFVELPSGARTALIVVDVVIWAFFVFDYVVRFTLAIPKLRFVRDEWVDLVLVVIPIFQPARLFGAFFRLARLSAAVERTTNNAGRLLGRHKLHLALAWAAGLVLIASVVTPVVEPDNGKIKSFGDGLWWAVVTTTTVGYGDLVPESTTGRVIGLVLMFAGVGIIGIITANIASMFIEPASSGPASDQDESTEPARQDAADAEQRESVAPDEHTSRRLDEIDRKLDEIMARLEQR